VDYCAGLHGIFVFRKLLALYLLRLKLLVVAWSLGLLGLEFGGGLVET